MLTRIPIVFAVLICISVSMVGAQAERSFDIDSVVTLFELVIDADENTARRCLNKLSEKIQTGEVAGDKLKTLRSRLSKTIAKLVASGKDGPLFFDAAVVAASWKDEAATEIVRHVFRDPAQTDERRLRAFDTLLTANKSRLPEGTGKLLSKGGSKTLEFQANVLASLNRCDDPRVAETVLGSYPTMDEELRPKAIELLTQRAGWSKSLMKSIGLKQIPKTELNANQVRKLLASRDEELQKLVIENWGTVRTQRNPAREQVIAEMRVFLRSTPADAHRGAAVFNKVCGQCHKIYGKGQDVGPDITGNGRASFEQLLSNVFDPSLVIGSAYQARTVITADGRVLTGLLVEDNDQRIVLKVQGGKRETIARDNVDEVNISKLSMMPEGLEKQLKPQELADLFAFITLDRPPSDSKSRPIPGAPRAHE